MPASATPDSFSQNAPLVLASKQVCGPDRLPVCFAFRLPANNESDSGWVFWSGLEDQAFINDGDNTLVCPLFAFIDMDVTLLDVIRNPVFTGWERDEVGGDWREVVDYFSVEDRGLR